MKGFSKTIVKLKVPILILALVLAIPSAVSYLHTKVNYDLLTYLPKDIDTMVGQDILIDEFGTGAFSMCIVEGMPEKEVSDLKKEIEQVDHVKKVLWYDSFLSTRIPMEMLPEEVYEAFNEGDATMMFVLFDESTSGDGTMAAVEEIRRIAGKKVFLAGMTGVLVDTCPKRKPPSMSS